MIKRNAHVSYDSRFHANSDYKSRVLKRHRNGAKFYFTLHTQYAFTVLVLIHMYRSFWNLARTCHCNSLRCITHECVSICMRLQCTGAQLLFDPCIVYQSLASNRQVERSVLLITGITLWSRHLYRSPLRSSGENHPTSGTEIKKN